MGTNYHNEVLRKARILERQRNANPGSEIELEDSGAQLSSSRELIESLKERESLKEMRHSARESESVSNVIGIHQMRQSYDHSRNGPLRDDTRRFMNLEMKTLLGPNPNHIHSVWKG